MDQGEAELFAPLPPTVRDEAASALGLDAEDLAAFPVQVVSTGLPYLIVPVTTQALGQAHVATADFESWLDRFGAKFVYVLDPALREGRARGNPRRVGGGGTESGGR